MNDHDDDNARSRPVAKFQFGGISAAVFRNEARRADGTTFSVFNTVLQRTYVDANGEYRTTSSFGVNDLPRAIACLQRAFEFCAGSRGSESDHAEA